MAAVTDRSHIVLPTAESIRIRNFNKETDLRQVDELEKNCEAGLATGKVSLFTDLLGDPLCRVRNYPAYSMLVAEIQSRNTIVGIVRAGVKQVARGTYLESGCETPGGITRSCNPSLTPLYASVAYVSGLRVSPTCRRLGIGLQLVVTIEEWCREQGAEYVYIATDNDNEASLNLFVKKLGYMKFRTPAILVQPVHAKARRLSSQIEIVKLSSLDAETMYRSAVGTKEFFPKDIDAVLKNPLNAGTWLSYYKGEGDMIKWLGGKNASWAVISLWRLNEIIRFEMRGASSPIKGYAAVSRVVDMIVPWMTIPSLPSVFKPFGLQVMYGIHAHGVRGSELLETLCWYAHNLAREAGCQVIASELSSCDPLKDSIPHWRRFSGQDIWCIKRLYKSGSVDELDWCKLSPSLSVFLDPRDF